MTTEAVVSPQSSVVSPQSVRVLCSDLSRRAPHRYVVERIPNPPMRYEVNVNGRRHTVDAAPDTPLLWVLRESLGLTGTKFGCGVAQCGACTIHLNGKPTRACVTPISSVGSAAVTTIEGLSADGSHAVQRAWVAEDVPQCGYCQAGQLMSAAALLATNASPTDAQIDAAMRGNLCRCGTYIRIRAAIHRAAQMNHG